MLIRRIYNGTYRQIRESVQDANPKVYEAMIKAELAFPYAEPEGLVILRSANEYVISLMDQSYLDYVELSWRAQAEGYVTPCFLSEPQIKDPSKQSIGENEYILTTDSSRFPEDFSLVESMGMCAYVRFRLRITLGSSFLGRISN